MIGMISNQNFDQFSVPCDFCLYLFAEIRRKFSRKKVSWKFLESPKFCVSAILDIPREKQQTFDIVCLPVCSVWEEGKLLTRDPCQRSGQIS